jgi:hypothetical protein
MSFEGSHAEAACNYVIERHRMKIQWDIAEDLR